jgi:hypothetical protein
MKQDLTYETFCPNISLPQWNKSTQAEHWGGNPNSAFKGKRMSTQSVQHNDDSAEPKPHEISVSVDGVDKHVPAGTYLVSDFKRLIGVDPSKELDEIIHGEFKPLDDNAKIIIEKHEKFVSHVKTGRSS